VGERRGDALRGIANRRAGVMSALEVAELDAAATVLDALSATQTEYQSTGDLHELARAVGNILGAADE
jgi:hypothetical protein